MTTAANRMLLFLLTAASCQNGHAYSIRTMRTPHSSRSILQSMQHRSSSSFPNQVRTRRKVSFRSTTNDENESNNNESNKQNPYADPNYPDLEFVDYSDPEYSADSGNYDDLYDSVDSTEAEIEAMREERRVKNDEFQFNTYYAKTYQKGATFAGEWTVYKVNWSQNDDDNDDDSVPTLSQFKQTFPVTTRLEPDEQGRWVHVEEYHSNITTTNTVTNTNKALDWNKYYKSYWPTAMIPFDFRGQQGNMVCGDAWTVCQAWNAAHESVIEGPFVQYRTEVGLSYGSLMRYRLKLDYSCATSAAEEDIPQPSRLQLQYLTVCREVVVERELHWPRDHPNYEIQEALFGEPGAEGGLYDPPPIADGTENNYILLDLPGHVTTLIPVVLDPSLSSSNVNWVTSLDWTPGKLRYQVDRKVNSGREMLGLRSLELSEVQAADAEEYRPRDGGQDMRQ